MAPSMFDVRRFIRLPRVQAVAPSPGGGWLAVQVERLDAEGARFISDLWRVDRSGHIPPHALTQGEASDRAPAFQADGTLLFLSDRPRPGTSEPRTQVWSLSPPGRRRGAPHRRAPGRRGLPGGG
jgi:dipeptidyl aminopeptidase/acylaminoacyl peptidase